MRYPADLEVPLTVETPMGRTKAAANNTESVAYMFDDSSVVGVVFQQESVVNSNTLRKGQNRLGISLNNLNAPANWKGNQISIKL